MTLGVTGQRPKNHRSVISPNLLPVVGDTAITVETSALNRKDLSGKSEGSMVVVLTAMTKVFMYPLVTQKKPSGCTYLAFLTMS